jgi:hypothetical protein
MLLYRNAADVSVGSFSSSSAGFACRIMSASPPIVLKNSKIARLRKSRKCSALTIQPLQGSAESMRGPAIVFAAIDVVPHIEARETHQRF